jgi:hypothetical protein
LYSSLNPNLEKRCYACEYGFFLDHAEYGCIPVPAESKNNPNGRDKGCRVVKTDFTCKECKENYYQSSAENNNWTCTLKMETPPQTVEYYVKSSGMYGGYCQCPSGNVYAVGDNRTNCWDLKCLGGVRSECFLKEGPWTDQSVDCNHL